MFQMLLTFFSSTKVVYLLRYQYLDHRGRNTVGKLNVNSDGKTWEIDTGKTQIV